MAKSCWPRPSAPKASGSQASLSSSSPFRAFVLVPSLCGNPSFFLTFAYCRLALTAAQRTVNSSVKGESLTYIISAMTFLIACQMFRCIFFTLVVHRWLFNIVPAFKVEFAAGEREGAAGNRGR